MATTAQEQVSQKQKKTLHPESFRLRPQVHEKLEYFSKTLKRKKISLVEEALERIFEEEEKKEQEVKQLKALLKSGDESGSTGGIPTLEEIVSLAKQRYNHD